MHHCQYEVMYNLYNVQLFNLIGVVSKTILKEVWFQNTTVLKFRMRRVDSQSGECPRPQSPFDIL